MNEVACRLLQPLWGRQRPTAQSYSHSLETLPGEGQELMGAKSYEGKKKAKRRRTPTPSTIGETDDDATASSVAT
eukprot:scaffold9150_cov120-Isochrysis_galbana.AAC.21